MHAVRFASGSPTDHSLPACARDKKLNLRTGCYSRQTGNKHGGCAKKYEQGLAVPHESTLTIYGNIPQF